MEKIKVKDLAVELGLDNKAVLAKAKELGIHAAKVAGSSLLPEEASRLREHFSPEPAKREGDVIVRRRRKAAGEPVAEDAGKDASAEAKAPTDAEAPDAASNAAPVSAKDAKDAPSGGEDLIQTPEPTGKPERKKTSGARVISRAGEDASARDKAAKDHLPEPPEDDAALAAQEKPQPAAPAPEQEKAEKTAVKPKDDKAPQQPEEQAAAQKDQPEEPDRPEQAAREAQPKGKGARIVDKPSPRTSRSGSPNVSAEPERDASGQALSSAPVMGHDSDSDRKEDDLNQSHATAARSDGKKEAASQVRVISRPDARTASAPAGQPGRGRAPHPGRSDSGRTDSGRAPYPGRPDAGRAGPGSAGRGDSSRPRPAADSPRPASTRSFPGDNLFVAPDSGSDSESRKKRQKGRRTVDFGAAEARRSGTGKLVDSDDGAWSRGTRRKGKKGRDVAPPGGTQPVKAVKRKIKVDEFIRVGDLAHQMGLKSGEIIKVLFQLGVMATINQSLDIDTATLVAAEFNYEVEKVGFSEEDVISAYQIDENPDRLVTRPPVVTIMGHVDHGKTSLLDAIRKSSVVTGEAGGITQHIGAYQVATKKGEIVFLDTPGHEAFTAMRARGAEVTDIVVLVVAADDGVMEQTREAINHSRAAKVPIMVAVNKIDKPDANPDRVKRELAEQGLVAEDWGGDTVFSYVSAKTREGLDELLELLALQADILELTADPGLPARGHIVEAKLDKGRGSIGTVLIQNGTLNTGDAFVCGVHSGRVRAMFDDQGNKVLSAGPSMPVEVQGFEGVPEAGDEFLCIADEKAARRIAEARSLKQRERELARESKVTLETFLARKADSVEALVLNLVVKSDVQGSLEAITDALNKLSNEKVRINVIHGGTGAISESDVLLASASNAIIIGFTARPTTKAKELAESESVDIRYYDIIYKLVEEIHSAMEGLLSPVKREVAIGSADVRDVFSVPKVGSVAGCHVSDGKILRNAMARLLRDGIVVYTGKISSLKRFKEDAREVMKGYECGIGLENFNDVKIGDVIEAYETVEEAAKM